MIMLHFLTIGAVLGLSAGLAPGPLLTLVISETLQHDIRAGVKVAVAPFITDLPIILFTFLVLSKISNSNIMLAFVSFCGSVFIMKMGVENIRRGGVAIVVGKSRPRSFGRGILANLLSPHPYLFWLSVGMPIMVKAMRVNLAATAVFLAGFYLLLVGSKVLLAVLVGKSKSFLSGNFYINTMRFLGAVLCVLAGVLFYDGVQLLLSRQL
jgi:threonine/homoserine/homoserine lactone efflux protein